MFVLRQVVRFIGSNARPKLIGSFGEGGRAASILGGALGLGFLGFSGAARAIPVIGGTKLVGIAQGNQTAMISSAASGAAGGGALALFKQMGIFSWLFVDLGINWLGWAFSALFKTEKYYDITGSLSFLTLSVGSLLTTGSFAPRQIIVSAMAAIWAARLGSFLVTRVHKVGKDSRFDGVRDNPGKFFIYWTMQALWVWISLSPVLIINTSASVAPLTLVDSIGGVVWLSGMVMEVVADRQKDVWRAKPENKGKFINEGLWSISRHPNYFGEMMIWWGVFLSCAPSFTTPAQWACVASPLFVMTLLRYVSGVPILEKQADERWGHLAEYQQYKANTPLLMPDLAKAMRPGYARVDTQDGGGQERR